MQAIQNSKIISNNIKLLLDCLELLASKRTTLEEKVIANYLHLLVIEYANILKSIHNSLNKKLNIEESVLEQLAGINAEVENIFAELLKMLKYDFNFFEQYYEYDFVARLTDKFDLLERLQAISLS